MKNILLLEDDFALCQGIALALKSPELTLRCCHSLLDARDALAQESFQLAVLDVNLPDGSGLELLKELRLQGSLPVILLTAKDTELDIVSGLELGADDYIPKPFSLAVLRARVNALLRRAEATGPAVFRQDSLSFDFVRLEYSKGGVPVELSKTEQKLLRCLIDNRGLTVPRERLMELVWSDGADYVDENALSVAIKRLRDKLEDSPSKPRFIKTVYGIGYTWVAKP